MNIEIHTNNFQMEIFGFGSVALNKDYVGTVFKLSSKTWENIKSHHLKNKGKNVWLYETGDKVFAGVELEGFINGTNYGLERNKINLAKYAYYRHIGPYNLIKQAGQAMTNELINQGFEIILPYVEIYGHWNSNESILETELLMCLK